MILKRHAAAATAQTSAVAEPPRDCSRREAITPLMRRWMTARDEIQSSADMRSAPDPVPLLWKGSSDAVALGAAMRSSRRRNRLGT